MVTKHVKFMVGIPAMIIIQAIFFFLAFDTRLSVNSYTIATGAVTEPVKLALVTDLHSCYHGNAQKELVNAVLREEPDVILFGGDIFDDAIPPENTIVFLQGVAGKAPCYYVSGNHEFWSGQADTFKDILISFGVKILEGTWEDLEIRGEKIRLCGIDDPDADRYRSR
ncbi:MAG: metallophosphoesterase, partial [Gracilibacteraceae bacterium]|nr:metallophosphoesterase [Gracilibacteraceae bacterium]